MNLLWHLFSLVASLKHDGIKRTSVILGGTSSCEFEVVATLNTMTMDFFKDYSVNIRPNPGDGDYNVKCKSCPFKLDDKSCQLCGNARLEGYRCMARALGFTPDDDAQSFMNSDSTTMSARDKEAFDAVYKPARSNQTAIPSGIPSPNTPNSTETKSETSVNWFGVIWVLGHTIACVLVMITNIFMIFRKPSPLVS